MQKLKTDERIKTQHENGDSTVRQFNSTTLRILENTIQDIMLSTLFDILPQHSFRSNTSKMIDLLVKCIARLTAILTQNNSGSTLIISENERRNHLGKLSSLNRSTQEDQVDSSLHNVQQENNLNDQELIQIAEMLRSSASQDNCIQIWLKKSNEIQQYNANKWLCNCQFLNQQRI
ncbi:unnamed protein product [Paramecium sonneborni]|uniref:Uncharacterized protein n=1 Tax=Paramecium sonneborni TaxID=65129 RepID=A0A8S1RPW2_9CILI|nr:unnamed protein product [Paramecium sonneborni]